MSTHETKFSIDLRANIDTKLYDTIELLNRNDIKTQFCCEGDAEERGNLILWQGLRPSTSLLINDLILAGAQLFPHDLKCDGYSSNCSLSIQPDTYYVEHYVTECIHNNLPQYNIDIQSMLRWFIDFDEEGRDFLIELVNCRYTN